MIKIKKLRGISIFICFTLLFSCFICTAKVKAEDRINIGDYIVFGSYLDEPITWIVVSENDTGVTLFSKDILTIKPFDAAESGNAGKGNNNVEKYGSSEWSNSNLREWLNSADKKVNYTTTPPNEKALGREKAYDKEKGFLYDFTQNEVSLINSIKNDDVGVYDKIFIPSLNQLKQIKESGFSLKAKPTKMAVKTYKERKISSNEYYNYCIRTSLTNSIVGVVIYLKNENSISYSVGIRTNVCCGVRPMVQLKTTLVINNGEGTEDDPYTLDIRKSSNSLADVSKNHWAYNSIKYLLEKDVIKLNTDGKIKPDENISTINFLELLSMATNYNYYDKKIKFAEIKDEHWMNELVKIGSYCVEKCKANGDRYSGRLNISREDAADILIYALDLQDEEYNDNTLNKFSDKDEIDYKDSVAIAVENNLMIGMNGKFEPKDSLTRAEAYTILYRIITGDF